MSNARSAATPLAAIRAEALGRLESYLARAGRRRARSRYQARLDAELARLDAAALAPRLFALASITAAARARGVQLGPAPGAWASSLTAFLLGASSLDPLRHGLHFLPRPSRGPSYLWVEPEGLERVAELVAEQLGPLASGGPGLDLHPAPSLRALRRAAIASGRIAPGSTLPLGAAVTDPAPMPPVLVGSRGIALLFGDRPCLVEAVTHVGARTFDELVAAVSLGRWSAVARGLLRDYLSGLTHAAPSVLRAAARDTRGVLLYDQQLGVATARFAGLDLCDGADLTAWAGPDERRTAAWRARFLAAALARGASSARAERVFDRLAEAAPATARKTEHVAFALSLDAMARLHARAPRAWARAAEETLDRFGDDRHPRGSLAPLARGVFSPNR
ncbi:MAG: hypothetical protein IT376_16530 [Polyangiaceae bacterium]|nr:hypothetical protein [Polyangiaceae bacterium]